MNALRTLKLSAVAIGALALTAGASSAYAQTETVNVTAVLQNTVTTNVAQQMNFGTVAAIPGDANDNSEDVAIALSAAGVVTVTPGANESAGAVVDNALATFGQVEVTNFADGATINIDISNIVDPTDREEHTSELQSHSDLVCRLLLEKKKLKKKQQKTQSCTTCHRNLTTH